MTAYLFVAIKTDNMLWAEDYEVNVPAIVHRHGGEFAAATSIVKRWEGDGPDPDRAVLMTFPSMEAIKAFILDSDYAPYRASRMAASSGDAFAFSTQ